MRFVRGAAFAGIVFAFTCGAIQAGEVVIKGAHLCCPACVKAVNAALKKAADKGVSDVSADKEAGTITFTAADDAAVKAGLRQISIAGFFGTVTHDGKEVPSRPTPKSKKVDSAKIANVHICCGNCEKAIAKALKDVEGVSDVKPDKQSKSVEISGKDIDVAEAIKALNKAGFFGRLPRSR